MPEQIDVTEARLTTHEQICAHRYEGIQARFDEGSKRMTKIEYLLYAVIAAVLLDWFVAFIAAASLVALTIWTARAVMLMWG
jgi:hypothetical protein